MFEFSPSAFESSRFQAWVYCVFFSMVCLVSHITFVDDGYYAMHRKQEEWTTAALSISMALSLVASVAYIIAKKRFESSVAEGGLAVLLLIFWVCALPFILRYAINGRGVQDTSLYVFSWVSFMCVLFVVQDLFIKRAKVAKWFGLAVVAVVLVFSAYSRYYSRECLYSSGEPLCKRLAYGISLGAITIPLSVCRGLSSMCSVLTTKAEASAAILALILHIFGVIFLTLGNNAPANYVGNMFFSTWISFFLSALLTRQCLADLYKQQPKRPKSTDASSTQIVHEEVPVEAFAVADDIENVERAIDDDDGHSA